MILVLGKARSCRVPSMGCRAAESPVWFDILPKKLCMRCDAWAGVVSWWNCQSPVAHSCNLLNYPVVSAGECSSLMQNLLQIHCSTHSIILNATATQYTCAVNGVYHLHWLLQWSHHCSRMCIPVHSPWLPGYVNVAKNCSCYINNGWTFSRQTSYMFI